ncbi:MAG: four helix bundle protein [Eubacteriales bacterium]
MALQSYNELNVWKKSIDLVEQIYLTTSDFPKDEMYSLTNQIRRAAISIPSNIAEGQARKTTKDFLNFLSIAQGSRAELETQVIIANRLKYIDDNKTEQLLSTLTEIAKMLYSLSSRLRSQIVLPNS